VRPDREKEAIELRFLSAVNGRRLPSICLTALQPNNLPQKNFSAFSMLRKFYLAFTSIHAAFTHT
jgi:hypothetical protein